MASFWDDGTEIEIERRKHDEALRMQALIAGAAIAGQSRGSPDEIEDLILSVAKWAYCEATGREW